VLTGVVTECARQCATPWGCVYHLVCFTVDAVTVVATVLVVGSAELLFGRLERSGKVVCFSRRHVR
jgi:hypothetical protein